MSRRASRAETQRRCLGAQDQALSPCRVSAHASKSVLTAAGPRSNLNPGTALLARVPGGAGYGAAGGVLALGAGGATVYAAASGELLHALAWAPGRPPAALAPLAPGRWLVGDDQVRRQGLAEGLTSTAERRRGGHDLYTTSTRGRLHAVRGHQRMPCRLSPRNAVLCARNWTHFSACIDALPVLKRPSLVRA